jgi:DNA-directed RNA polymerase subunit RPC12/RpoP
VTTETRCPNCGGMVSGGAEWCGQCYARLDHPGVPKAQPAGERSAPPGEPGSVQPAPLAEREPQVPPTAVSTSAGGSGPVRRTDRGLVWTCPRCDLENPIESPVCTRCGTKFDRLFSQPEQRHRGDPDRAARLSLLFPGAGHIAAGRAADGFARAVLFVWTALTVVAILVMRGGSPGPFLPVLVPYAAAAVGVYAVTVVDARRAAEGYSPLISSRVMLYGVVGLILFTVAILFVFSTRIR